MVRRAAPSLGPVALNVSTGSAGPARLARLGLVLAVVACSQAAPPTPSPHTAVPPSATQSPALATPTVVPAGPPFPARDPAGVVFDMAGVLAPPTEASAAQLIYGVQEVIGAEVVAYIQLKPGATAASTAADARALLADWQPGRPGHADGVVILFNLDETLCAGEVGLVAGAGYAAEYLSEVQLQAIRDEGLVALLEECDPGGALLLALERIDENARETGPLD